ncbi:RNA polymerase sigma factor [Marinoscillum sp.]|uniref:RNA polymerase sigma factor n=1 Tax=Marinoscillum sp. TaxID=2024838 RepID=UPI003BAD2BCC
MNDHDLVAAVLKGNMKAFAILVEQHKRLVASIVSRLLDDDMEREEVCQDVFMRVYEKIHSFNFDSKLSTWIGTIAFRLAANRLKKLKGRKALSGDLEAVKEPGREDMQVEANDYSSFVRSVVDQMPAAYRSVLLLYYLDGYSYPEIVEITKWPEGTVKNYIYRAKAKLRELMEPYIGTEI